MLYCRRPFLNTISAQIHANSKRDILINLADHYSKHFTEMLMTFGLNKAMRSESRTQNLLYHVNAKIAWGITNPEINLVKSVKRTVSIHLIGWIINILNAYNCQWIWICHKICAVTNPIMVVGSPKVLQT